MIVVNLDSVIEAPMSTLSLSEIMSSLEWPDNATCATQEIDGEILFWNMLFNAFESLNI